MKRKNKVPIEERVEKPIKKKLVSKAKESQKMLQLIRWTPTNSNGLDKLVWKTCSTCSGQH